jgi:hypothetical protein
VTTCQVVGHNQNLQLATATDSCPCSNSGQPRAPPALSHHVHASTNANPPEHAHNPLEEGRAAAGKHLTTQHKHRSTCQKFTERWLDQSLTRSQVQSATPHCQPSTTCRAGVAHDAPRILCSTSATNQNHYSICLLKRCKRQHMLPAAAQT